MEDKLSSLLLSLVLGLICLGFVFVAERYYEDNRTDNDRIDIRGIE